MGVKTCTQCRITKEIERFFCDKRSSDGRYSSCKDCQNARTQAWRDANRERYRAQCRQWAAANKPIVRAAQKRWYLRNQREAWLKFRYKITLEQFEQMMVTQKGVCAICGRVQNNPRANMRLCVDHDALTGQVRGLLCDACNRGIGSFADDPDRLRRAADYLDGCKAENNSPPEEVQAA